MLAPDPDVRWYTNAIVPGGLVKPEETLGVIVATTPLCERVTKISAPEGAEHHRRPV